jgi:hypothetical protein
LGFVDYPYRQVLNALRCYLFPVFRGPLQYAVCAIPRSCSDLPSANPR